MDKTFNLSAWIADFKKLPKSIGEVVQAKLIVQGQGTILTQATKNECKDEKGFSKLTFEFNDGVKGVKLQIKQNSTILSLKDKDSQWYKAKETDSGIRDTDFEY